jgi:anti-sigma regulatory factor (Ser/Thr protein kinase)
MFVQPPTTRFPARSLASVADLSELRTEFTMWLEGAGMCAERVDDISVVFSELGANAVRETPVAAEPATVAASIDGSTLMLEFANTVRSEAPTPEDKDWDLDDPLRTGGRGLLLVSAFVDRIDVDVVDRRLVVRCEASLDPGAA